MSCKCNPKHEIDDHAPDQGHECHCNGKCRVCKCRLKRRDGLDNAGKTAVE